jgi:hypothetical protein
MIRMSLRACGLGALVLVSCDKSDGAPSAPSASAPPSARAAAPSAPPPAAASSPDTLPAAEAGAAAATQGGGAACGRDGTYEAVAYACKGEKKQSFPGFIHWKFTMNGTDAPFTESTSPPMPKCASTQKFEAKCTADPIVLTLTPKGPSACEPANCLGRSANGAAGGQCGKTPDPVMWSVSEQTPTSFVSTSVEPFKITTCTANHKSNPLTVWWQKKS